MGIVNGVKFCYNECVSTLRNTIGQVVRVERVRANLSQEELGSKVGTSRQTILSIERGLTNPGYVIAYLLSKRLEFSLDDVLPNIPRNKCVCHLFGSKECNVCK